MAVLAAEGAGLLYLALGLGAVAREVADLAAVPADRVGDGGPGLRALVGDVALLAAVVAEEERLDGLGALLGDVADLPASAALHSDVDAFGALVHRVVLCAAEEANVGRIDVKSAILGLYNFLKIKMILKS